MNKKNSRGAGYTIVEVMIFLAVSTALLIATLALMSGQREKQEFYQAVRETDSKIRDVINDFSTGFFPDSTNFGCTADSSGNAPVISASASEQGTRVGCAFIGKVIHFAPQASGRGSYRVITVVGRQFKGASLSELVENIVQAKPVPLDVATVVENGTFGYGLRAEKMTYTDSGGLQQPAGAIGFFSSFAEIESGDVQSGKQTTQTIVIPGTSLDQTDATVSTAIRAIGSGNWSTFKPAYVNRTISICFVGGTNQHGIIKLGDNRRQISTTLTIGGGIVCP